MLVREDRLDDFCLHVWVGEKALLQVHPRNSQLPDRSRLVLSASSDDLDARAKIKFNDIEWNFSPAFRLDLLSILGKKDKKIWTRVSLCLFFSFVQENSL